MVGLEYVLFCCGSLDCGWGGVTKEQPKSTWASDKGHSDLVDFSGDEFTS